MNTETDNYQSLLNPDNMRAFYQYYDTEDLPSIYQRFNLSNEQQVHALHRYFDSMIREQLSMQDNVYAFTAYGKLMQKALSQSYAQIERTLPLELETRYLALNISSNGLDCAYYISQVASPLKTQSICDLYDFSDVNDLKLFVNATWYNGTYQTQLMQETLLTLPEVWQLYDTSVPTSLGTAITRQCEWISTSFGCSSPQNCSSTYLASLQWGSSQVTLNPPNPSAEYCPYSQTMSNWGAYKIADMPQPPEYYYYSQLYFNQTEFTATKLNTTQVELVQNPSINSFGLNSMYNAARITFAQFSNFQRLL